MATHKKLLSWSLIKFLRSVNHDVTQPGALQLTVAHWLCRLTVFELLHEIMLRFRQHIWNE